MHRPAGSLQPFRAQGSLFCKDGGGLCIICLRNGSSGRDLCCCEFFDLRCGRFFGYGGALYSVLAGYGHNGAAAVAYVWVAAGVFCRYFRICHASIGGNAQQYRNDVSGNRAAVSGASDSDSEEYAFSLADVELSADQFLKRGCL